MAGLDRVKGPHWSQILAMFGPGGTIDESLKDRNQVQLKDKARNLKLFFLKSGIEVPYYLQFVTGELKTRAPAQAAKNEARERQKQSEDRAHIEGVMTLAGGSLMDFTGPGATPTAVNGGEREITPAIAAIDGQQQLQDDAAQIRAKTGTPDQTPAAAPATADGVEGYELKLSRSLQEDAEKKAVEAQQAAAIAAAVAAAQS